MKLSSGKRIGQSSQELRAAVSFSLTLHVIVFLAAVLVLYKATPRRYVPPFYNVNLVEQPKELAPAPAPEPPPVPPKPEEKPAAKPKIAIKKEPKPAPKKSDMPELAKRKQEKAQQEQPASKERAEPVDVKSTPGSEALERSGYLALVTQKIKNNWKYHAGVPKDSKVKVIIVILRSGLVEDVQLEESSGIFHFDQAAIRAIRTSSPFPPFPEGVYKQNAIVSADLTPEPE